MSAIESLIASEPVAEHFRRSSETLSRAADDPKFHAAIHSIADAIIRAFREGHKLLIAGNGGSAADAQHIAAEFVNRFMIERPPLPAIALTTDTSILTSIANDYSYNEVFAKQVLALGKEGDVAVALSTSGNSPNVIAAIDVCKRTNITTIGLTGGTGGQMAGKVEFLLNVSEGRKSARIQETHILVAHVICDLVDQRLFPSK